jgi:hypothetical protein
MPASARSFINLKFCPSLRRERPQPRLSTDP